MTRKGLEELIERERILMFGEPGSGKTESLLWIALDNPKALCFLIDPDAGTAKAVKELGGPKAFKNLEYRLCPSWTDVFNAYQEAKECLKAGDWLLIDQMGRLWDSAQNYYSEYTYKETAVDHLLNQARSRQEAKAKIKELAAKGVHVDEKGGMMAGGFEANTEWTVIKRLHNDQVVDDAVIKQVFNIAATSAGKELTPMDKAAKADFNKKWVSMFEPIGIKPEGEKHNIYRFDTIAFLGKKPEGGQMTYNATILRDRGRAEHLLETFDTTGSGFYSAYKALLDG